MSYRAHFVVEGNDRFECLANNFKIMDDRGVLLFSADRNEVIIGSDGLRIMGEGGTSFSGSIQTTLVRAESGHDLRFVSTFIATYFPTILSLLTLTNIIMTPSAMLLKTFRSLSMAARVHINLHSA